ncbi:putative cyclin-D7-1 isoform X2 [Asparagus officinalis]|uniref:putative cyclin-D7-1 isoform X2 n=1 Tax=Asparagus officinalis TaxID=4686 RepID=UPI00098E5275|nr:putative cyclin-D7-1 isoform X2 [Asparagus officinalis]
MGSNDLLLLCDERLFLSTPSPSPGSICHCNKNNISSPAYDSYASDEENDHLLRNYLRRERIFMSANGYLEQLRVSSELRDARFRAVRWILMARRRLSLQCGTIFAAVNYLDRFLSLNCHIKWEIWMIELSSIACLSIASKVDEVFIHSLDDFQTDDLEHTYQSSTIVRMELTILKALDWRLICVTPYSYIDLFTSCLPSHDSLHTRTVEILYRALLEIKFVECNASVIAVSALRCCIEELFPLEFDAYVSTLGHLMPVEYKAKIDKCYRFMEEKIANPHSCPTSPVTVIPLQRTKVLDSCVDIDMRFCNKNPSQDFNQNKRKYESLTSCSSN